MKFLNKKLMTMFSIIIILQKFTMQFPRNSVMEFQNICNEMVAPFFSAPPCILILPPIRHNAICQNVNTCRLIYYSLIHQTMYTVHCTAAISSESDHNFKQAVNFIRVAWQNVSPVVIQNCSFWLHARFINKDSLVTNSQVTNESVAVQL